MIYILGTRYILQCTHSKTINMRFSKTWQLICEKISWLCFKQRLSMAHSNDDRVKLEVWEPLSLPCSKTDRPKPSTLYIRKIYKRKTRERNKKDAQRRELTHELKTKDRVKKNQKVIGMNESITKKVSRRGDYTYFVYCRSSAGFELEKREKERKKKGSI